MEELPKPLKVQIAMLAISETIRILYSTAIVSRGKPNAERVSRKKKIMRDRYVRRGVLGTILILADLVGLEVSCAHE